MLLYAGSSLLIIILSNVNAGDNVLCRNSWEAPKVECVRWRPVYMVWSWHWTRSHMIWQWQAEGWRSPGRPQELVACSSQISSAPVSGRKMMHRDWTQGPLLLSGLQQQMCRAWEQTGWVKLNHMLWSTAGLGTGVVPDSSWIHWQRFSVIQDQCRRRQHSSQYHQLMRYTNLYILHPIICLCWIC